MKTKRSLNKNKNTRKNKNKSGKKWTTAIEAATKTLEKTGSLTAAKKSLRKQALTNARKLFGSLRMLK